jgi:hypothetical protein
MTISLTVSSPQSATPHCIRFDQPRVTLGRGQRCDIRLPLQVISTHHLTIQWEQGRCLVTDVGSTNGTFLRGQRLVVGQPTALPAGATLRVVDVTLTFEFGEAAPEGFTLAESGTMVRQMVRDALHQGSDDQAFIEVLRGPQVGRRVALDDALDAGVLGAAPDALLRLDDPAIPARALLLSRQGDGFAAIPADGYTARRNNAPITQALQLTSRDRLTIGPAELIFFDPLQDYLSALDEPASSTAPARQSQPTQEAAAPPAATPAPPQPPAAPTPAAKVEARVEAKTKGEASAQVAGEAKKETRRGLTRAELIVLIASVGLILCGVGLLAYLLAS